MAVEKRQGGNRNKTIKCPDCDYLGKSHNVKRHRVAKHGLDVAVKAIKKSIKKASTKVECPECGHFVFPYEMKRHQAGPNCHITKSIPRGRPPKRTGGATSPARKPEVANTAPMISYNTAPTVMSNSG